MTGASKGAHPAPENVAAHPLEIAADPSMSKQQKIDALERWRDTLLQRIRATEEGMTPPADQTAEEDALVEQIAKALQLVKGEADLHGSRPAKA